MEYNFNEKEKEMGLPVWQSPKYIESKKKAIEMIESKKYDLSTADFWILMNKTKDGSKMAYTGLIISHNGCLKINDNLETKVNPKCFTLDKDGYANSLVYTYIDDDTFEVGEFNATNGKNAYPYAMAFKRCFDRVVLKKSKLAYSGIYSEVEADEFKEQIEPQEITQEEAENYTLTFGKYKDYTISEILDDGDDTYVEWLLGNTKDERLKQIIYTITGWKEPNEEEQQEKLELMVRLNNLVEQTNQNRETLYKKYKVTSDKDMTIADLKDAIGILEKKVGE